MILPELLSELWFSPLFTVRQGQAIINCYQFQLCYTKTLVRTLAQGTYAQRLEISHTQTGFQRDFGQINYPGASF